MKSIQKLREERKAKALEMRNLLDKFPGESWGEEQQKAWNALEVDVDRLDGEIDRIQKTLDIEAANKERLDAKADKMGKSADEVHGAESVEKGIFRAWLAGGAANLTEEQRVYVAQRVAEVRNAMGTQVPAEGGYLVTDEFSGRLLEELKAYGGVRKVATVYATATGANINWPTVDATAQEGEQVGENAATSSQDISFGNKDVGAYKYSSKAIAVPFELLQDSAIDIEAYIRKLAAERIARITNRKFTVGTGTNEPEGVVTASTLGKTGVAGQLTSIIYDDLVDLEHSIDPAYREAGGVGWMFHDLTLKALKKLKDADGRPIWVPGITMGEPNTILSYPYTINQHMDAPGASKKSVLFGALDKYLIRDVMQILFFRMTDSVFTTKGQVGFIAFSRHDGKLLDVSGQSVKHFLHPAT